MRLLLVASLAVGAVLLGAVPATAQAAPCGHSDVRLCDPSKVYYCPSTGQMVTWLAPCPEYGTGPHQSGMEDGE